MSKVKRHAVTIKRPSTSLDGRGQRTGSPTVIANDVPCSIEPLSGRELELARQVVANATQRVEMYYDPDWALSTNDFLVFGTRTLSIGHIDNKEEIDLEVSLLCGEAVA